MIYDSELIKSLFLSILPNAEIYKISKIHMIGCFNYSKEGAWQFITVEFKESELENFILCLDYDDTKNNLLLSYFLSKVYTSGYVGDVFSNIELVLDNILKGYSYENPELFSHFNRRIFLENIERIFNE